MIYKNWEDCGGLSDCEELVKVSHRWFSNVKKFWWH